MAGGASLIRGMSELISKETQLPVFLAPDPISCVVLGAGRYLDELAHIKKSRKLFE